MNTDLQPADPNERNWGAAMHLSAFFGMLLPLGLVLGPLLFWLLKKHDSEFLNTEGKKAINFQLTILVGIFALLLLSFIVRPFIAVAFMAGFAGLIFAAYAGYNTYNNKEFEYPFTLIFIK